MNRILSTCFLFAAAVSSVAFVSPSAKTVASVPAFVLVCSPTDDVAATIAAYDVRIRSVHVSYDAGVVEMRLNPSDDGQLFSAATSDAATVAPGLVSAAWSDDDTWFSATSDDDKTFVGELIYAEDFLVPVRCAKVVTDERDSDEFTLACVPSTDYNLAAPDLVVRDVILAYENLDLEMRLNATGKAQIFDFERASHVLVDNDRVHATWEREATIFAATSSDYRVFTAELVYGSNAPLTLACVKI